MRIKNIAKVLAWLTLTCGLTLIAPTRALAHCDSLDGRSSKRRNERSIPEILRSP